ncbi:hypothetical protein ACHAXA_011913 [Cyclostephanos tholiformis]|uniref:Uncharacterized protein n=1 Tax=Cyclostephanos tholiformis TaxID=382380 RepID=A0ABD3SCE0_9STRA
MGSAFLPVKPRDGTSSPMALTSDLNSGAAGALLRPKRTCQGSSLRQKIASLDDINEETPPDNMSVSVSDASTKGSIHSQPTLLDFVGDACCASSWFTSIFPCAILDINDNDDRVVDKLSRESAMNVMYSNVGRSQEFMDHDREQDLNIMFIRLPEEAKRDALHCHPIPAVIEDETDLEVDSDEDEVIGAPSLNDGPYDMQGTIAPIVNRVFAFSPHKLTKFGIQRVFRRKRQ